jgi:very-short-patch-repair endonuclease
MTPTTLHSRAWALSRSQHGVVSRAQLLALGFTPEAIRHRMREGRLHRRGRGVYAVGRPELTRHGEWMGAVLEGGPGAVLSHSSAAALHGICPDLRGPIEITVPARRTIKRAGISAHRRAPVEVTRVRHIPVTSSVQTLLDLSARLDAKQLEAAVNEADKRDLVDPETLRAALDGRPRAAKLRKLLDRRTFALTDSELERRFMPVARAAGLSQPQTQTWLNGFRVDFFWPELNLVVEADSLRYHRTPAQQATDRVRDQVHAAAGLTTLRFTHAQVAYEPEHVRQTLAAVAARLG